jgi:uncharacterized protein YciW
VEALLLLADLCVARLDFATAHEHASRAVEAARTGGYTLLAAAAQARLAAARLGLDDPAGCLEDGRRALRVQRRAGQRLAYARTLVTLGFAYDRLGRRALAEARWRTADEVFLEVGVPEKAAGQRVQWNFGGDSRVGATVPVDL